GHRLMMDRVVPGGVATDLSEAGRVQIPQLVAEAKRGFPALVRLYEETASLQDRTVGTGFTRPDLVRQFAAGGFVGRASGRDFDVRRVFPNPPYDRFSVSPSVLEQGDVDARIRVRIQEIEQSLSLIDQLVTNLPAGEIRIACSLADGEGIALVEGFRGDI